MASWQRPVTPDRQRGLTPRFTSTTTSSAWIAAGSLTWKIRASTTSPGLMSPLTSSRSRMAKFSFEAAVPAADKGPMRLGPAPGPPRAFAVFQTNQSLNEREQDHEADTTDHHGGKPRRRQPELHRLRPARAAACPTLTTHSQNSVQPSNREKLCQPNPNAPFTQLPAPAQRTRTGGRIS